MKVHIIYNTEAPVDESICAVLDAQVVGTANPLVFYITQYLGHSTYTKDDVEDLDYNTYTVF